MAGRILLLVTALAAGCVERLPKGIYVESRFSDEEEAAIVETIDEVNVILGEELLGHPVLVYLGRYEDSNGFDQDDFGDDVHVLYKMPRDSEEYRWVSCVTGRNYGGYATLHDVLMVRTLEEDKAGFKRTLRHEFGHFLMLSHSPDPRTLMYVGDMPRAVETFSYWDKLAFCLIHDCLYEPQPPEEEEMP